jgi:hypothetical protein
MQTSLLAAIAVIATLTGPAFAEDKTTTIERNDGTTDTVYTDSQGTTVTNSKDGGTYQSGGDRHQDQVDQSVRSGGKVVPNPQ